MMVMKVIFFLSKLYKAWRTKTGKLLYDMFHNIRKNDASIYWLTEDILQELRHIGTRLSTR